jgi:hypothetical protein
MLSRFGFTNIPNRHQHQLYSLIQKAMTSLSIVEPGYPLPYDGITKLLLNQIDVALFVGYWVLNNLE